METETLKFKSLLEQRLHRLLDLTDTAASAAAVVELDQTRVGRLSRMDALQGQAMSQATQQRRKIEIQKITAALRRIESGAYGHCQQCDEPIALPRLEFDPATPLCIDCATSSDA